MNKIEEIKDLLYKVQRTHMTQQAAYIQQLQDKIWDETEEIDEELREFLSDLAYTLNFYENDDRDRDEDLGYYGDEKLDEILDNAIKRLEEHL